MSDFFDHGSSRQPHPHHRRPPQHHRTSSGHFSYPEPSSPSTLRRSPPQSPFAHSRSGDVHLHPAMDAQPQQRSPTSSEYHYQYSQQQHQQHHQQPEHLRLHYSHASDHSSPYSHQRSNSYHPYQQQPQQDGHSSSTATSPSANPSHSLPSPNSSFYKPPQPQQQQHLHHPQQQHLHSTSYPFEHTSETQGPSPLRDYSRRRSVKEEEPQESSLSSLHQQYSGTGEGRKERIRQQSSSSSSSTHRPPSHHSSPDSPPRSPPLPLQPLTIKTHGLNNVAISSASSSAFSTVALTAGTSSPGTKAATPQPDSTTTRSPQTPPRTPSPRKYSERAGTGEPDNDMKSQLSRSSTGGSTGGRRGGPILNHSHRAGHRMSTREAASSCSSTTSTGVITGTGAGGLCASAAGEGGEGEGAGGGGGGGRGGGGSAVVPVGPNRRLAHILSEQKRREKINGGFDELKSVIPECAQNTDSKATILRKAVDYILQLEDEIRRYTDAYPPPPSLPPSSQSLYTNHRGSAGGPRGQVSYDDSDS